MPARRPMEMVVCAVCRAPTPRYVPNGPVYCSGKCWREAAVRALNGTPA